jgi:hypothetical protein
MNLKIKMLSKLEIIINKIYTNLNLILVSALILLMYIFNDYSDTIISGDAEPDYIANSVNILYYFKPIGFHHPGTINYYFLSGILFTIKIFKLNLIETIIACRVSYWLVLLIITFRINNSLKIKDFTIKYVICVIILLSIPELRELVFKISAEALLFPITILFYYFYINNEKTKFAIIFGLMLNIKFSCILLIPVFYQKLKNENYYTIIKVILIPFLIYIITTFPAVSSFEIIILPLYQTVLRIYSIFKVYFKYDINLMGNAKMIIVLMILIIFISLYFITRIKIQSKPKFSFIRYFIISMLTIYLYNNQVQIFRHFVPLIIFSVFFINLNKIKLNINILLFMLFILIITSTFENIKIGKTEISIDKYIRNQKEKCYIFQASNFKSRILFLKWAEYRYANSNKILPNVWYVNEGIIENKIEYLNTRNPDFINASKNELTNQLYSSIFKYDANFKIQLNEIILKKSNIIIESNHDSEFLSIINPLVKKIDSTIKLKVTFEGENFKSYTFNK